MCSNDPDALDGIDPDALDGLDGDFLSTPAPHESVRNEQAEAEARRDADEEVAQRRATEAKVAAHEKRIEADHRTGQTSSSGTVADDGVPPLEDMSEAISFQRERHAEMRRARGEQSASSSSMAASFGESFRQRRQVRGSALAEGKRVRLVGLKSAGPIECSVECSVECSIECSEQRSTTASSAACWSKMASDSPSGSRSRVRC